MPASQEDLDFLELLALNAISNWAENGELHPFAVVEVLRDGTPGLMVLPAPPGGFDDQDAKRRYVNVLRYMSIENDSPRAGYAMETWSVLGTDEETIRLLDEIKARGGSYSEHPAATEALWMSVESDAGTTIRSQAILRDGDTVTLGEPRDDFQERGEDKMTGIFSGYHVPTQMKRHPMSRIFAQHMASIVGFHEEPLTPEPGPPVN